MNSGNYNSLIKLASPQTNPATYSLPARDAEFYKSFTNPATYKLPSSLPARDAEFYKSITSLPEGHLLAKLNPRSRAMINAVGRRTAAGAAGGGTAGVTMSELAKLNPRARANTIRTEAAAGNTAPADSYIPGTYPAVNPDTGGTRLMHYGKPVGPGYPHSGWEWRQNPLPITPYSSGKINISSMDQASRQADLIDFSRSFNELGKLRNAENLDAMFKRVHRINLTRRSLGMPDYVPNAMDVYASNALSAEDYAEAEKRMLRDLNMSTVAQTAADRGTPLHEGELMALRGLSPYRDALTSYSTQVSEGLPTLLRQRDPDPDTAGKRANGFYSYYY